MPCLLPAEVGEFRIGLALPPSGSVPLGLAVANEEEPGHPARLPGSTVARSHRSHPCRTEGPSLAAVAELGDRFGPGFAEVAAASRLWCNGEPVDAATPIGPDDELAVLPPVSGG